MALPQVIEQHQACAVADENANLAGLPRIQFDGAVWFVLAKGTQARDDGETFCHLRACFQKMNGRPVQIAAWIPARILAAARYS